MAPVVGAHHRPEVVCAERMVVALDGDVVARLVALARGRDALEARIHHSSFDVVVP